MKLASTRLVTKDVARLAQFYRTLLGIDPAGTGDYVEFRTPGSILALCSQRTIDEHNAGGARAAANRSSILEFQVEDVDAEWSRLRGIVAEWVLAPTNQPWGNRSMLFRDPDGNLINIFAPAGRTAA